MLNLLICSLLSMLTSPVFASSHFLSDLFNPEPTVAIGDQLLLQHHMNLLNRQLHDIDSKALLSGVTAYLNARRYHVNQKPLLTIIDYSKPSSARRLWVIDMRHDKVLFNTWVAHGKNSGNIFATSFSNQPGSLKSSIGVFLTEHPYHGGNGYSLRLSGLERGINDNAYRRDIVFHGAKYAAPHYTKTHGYVGRSWGCPAVSPVMVRPLINTIKDKSLVVVYYPDGHWLRNSTFLAAG